MRARYEISGMRLIWSRGSWPVGQEVSAGPRREFDDELHRRDRVVTANDDGRNRSHNFISKGNGNSDHGREDATGTECLLLS